MSLWLITLCELVPNLRTHSMEETASSRFHGGLPITRFMINRLPGGVVVLLLGAGIASAQQPADLVLHNGRIASVDEAFSIHQAIVVKDGRILAVGSNDLAKTYRAARTVDLRGRLVIPGFNDTHIHLSGQARRHVNLAGMKSIKEIQQRVLAKARELGPGEWVTGSAWSEDELAENRRPLRRDLDEVAPDNPVIITRAGGHSAVANSLALKLASVTKDTPQPEGGVIEKDETGELNGVIRERQGIVSRLVPAATAAELRASLIENIRNVLRLGITSFTLAGTSPEGYAEWEEIYRAHGESLPRATVQIRWAAPEGRNEQTIGWGGAGRMKAFGRKTGAGNDRLKVGAVKVSVDGGFTGPAAYTLQPYKGQPNYRGYLNFTEAQIYEMVKTGHDLGWQMGFHAIGDAAIELTVDIFERVLGESPRANHRHYLNHFTIPPPVETMKKMAANRILITQQPNFTYTLEGRYAEYLDGYRLEHNNPVATPWKTHGIFMAFSADVLPIGPLVGLYTAVTRKGMSGKVWGADERVSVRDAIRAYTVNSAYINFDETIKGTLEPGKLADMVVLADDLLTMDSNRLKDARIDMTIVGGKVLYERGEARRRTSSPW
jgi:predicted amidohydrolase YtcJ